MNSTTQFFTLMIVLLTMVVSIIVTQFVRRRRDFYVLRPIPAYTRLPLLVGQGIEANQPVHVSLGSAGLGGESTLLALASAELFYQVAQRSVIGGTPPILSVSDSSAVPLAQDTLRRAYTSRGMLSRYPRGSIRWYPGGGRSLAFAAALTATMAGDRVSSNVLAGSFGAELALPAETAARRGQQLIATSSQLEGQAVAYVMADEALIGEEVFAAGAYLTDKAAQIGSLSALDTLRWLLIIGILIPTIVALGDYFLQGRFSAAIARLLGGG